MTRSRTRFDTDAPVIDIADEDFRLWYLDAMDNLDKYMGKTVRFKGQVARLRKEKEGMFAPGRFVMTCCEADITFMGIPCKFAGASALAVKSCSDGGGQVPQPLQGRRPDPDRQKCGAGGACRPAGRNILSASKTV